MRIPNPHDWKSWGYEEYIIYFLSIKAARRRLRGEGFPIESLSKDEMREFCRPIKNRIVKKFDSNNPDVSITLSARNEQLQILPTLISYTLLDCGGGNAELIVVNNDSNDRTGEIARECGVKVVVCERQGLPYAREAGLESASDEAEYIWISDADVRVVSPIYSKKELPKKGTPFKTSYSFLESNPKMAGVSSGAVVEASHWLYGITHTAALTLNMTNKYSCWSGPNQFMKKWALEASGGINTEMGGSSEDHVRQYQLARWAKENDMHMASANSDKRLADPVYHSGRRVGTAKRVLKSIWNSITRENLKKGDHWSETRHTGERKWERVKSRSSKEV